MEGPFNDREYMLLRSAIAREQEACSTVEEEGELTAILKNIEDKIYYMQHPDERLLCVQYKVLLQTAVWP